MKLLGLIFDNAGLKVLALGMAWAMWFMVSQSLSGDVTVVMNLEIQVDESGAVRATATAPEPPNPQVSITITGPARSVADFDRVAGREPAVIQVGQQHYPQDMEKTAVFRLEDLKIPDLADFPGLRATSMEPHEIRVNVERMEVRDIQVERPEIRDRSGSVDVRIVTWDTVVKVRASAKDLPKRLAALRTSVDPRTLLQLAGSIGEEPSINEEVPLTIDPTQADLFELVDRSEIKVRLELRQIDESEFVVPVRIFRGGFGPDTDDREVHFSPGNAVDVRLQGIYDEGVGGNPPSLRLTLAGSPAAIAAVDPALLIAFVLADEMPSDDTLATLANLPVHVAGLPVGVRLTQPITLSVERDR